MHLEETFAGKAATHGKNRVIDFGVYVLESLSVVGIPAEQVTSALMSLSSSKESKKNSSNIKAKELHKKRKRRTKAQGRDKRTYIPRQEVARRSEHLSDNCRRTKSNDLIHRALRFVIEVRGSTPQEVISRILFCLADALGDSFDQPSQRDLERAVGAFVENTAHKRHMSGTFYPPLGRAINGIVISYREREESIAPASMRRIRRGMHFNVPLRPFIATVKLLPPPKQPHRLKNHKYSKDSEHDDLDLEMSQISLSSSGYSIDELNGHEHDLEEQDLIGRMVANDKQRVSECILPCTPSSFPPTPSSRNALMGDMSEFTENVLYRARDELRGEHERNDRSRMAIFDPKQAHPKILLSCGGHCAALVEHCDGIVDQFTGLSHEEGGSPTSPTSPSRLGLARIYRSVRAALSVQENRITYFEVCPLWSGATSSEMGEQTLSVCVGLSTTSMQLRNTVPGCAPDAVGLDSSGVLLLEGNKARTNSSFTYGSVVGVYVYFQKSRPVVKFFVDGQPVMTRASDSYDPTSESNETTSTFVMTGHSGPSDAVAYYPTVSIKSTNVKVFCHFSAADMRHPPQDNEFWRCILAVHPHEPIYALDGTGIFPDS